MTPREIVEQLRGAPFAPAELHEAIAILQARLSDVLARRPHAHCHAGHPLSGPDSDVYVQVREGHVKRVCRACRRIPVCACGHRLSRHEDGECYHKRRGHFDCDCTQFRPREGGA